MWPHRTPSQRARSNRGPSGVAEDRHTGVMVDRRWRAAGLGAFLAMAAAAVAPAAPEVATATARGTHQERLPGINAQFLPPASDAAARSQAFDRIPQLSVRVAR